MKYENRSKTNKFYMCGLKICQSKSFDLTINVCIVLNTVVLSLDKYPIEKALEDAIYYINFVFFGVFLIEMIIKHIGLGYKSYFKETSNVFDFVIVVVSTADIVLEFALNAGKDGSVAGENGTNYGSVI